MKALPWSLGAHVDIDDEHLDMASSIISSQDRSGPEMKENNIIHQ